MRSYALATTLTLVGSTCVGCWGQKWLSSRSEWLRWWWQKKNCFLYIYFFNTLISFLPCASSVFLLSMGLWVVLCCHPTPFLCSRAPAFIPTPVKAWWCGITCWDLGREWKPMKLAPARFSWKNCRTSFVDVAVRLKMCGTPQILCSWGWG